LAVGYDLIKSGANDTLSVLIETGSHYDGTTWKLFLKQSYLIFMK